MILRIDCGQTFADDELTRGGVWAVGQIVPLVLQRLGVAENDSNSVHRHGTEPLAPAGSVVESLVGSF
ncbi:MAG: hypothetical protein K8T25_07465 [Planctomycetia bacterium]|nr:hypothetical protein [Planctomycetia bacterium]